MAGRDVLELDSRRGVYQHVARNPGKYLRELQRDLGMAMGALEYHLGELEKAGLVRVEQQARKRFFPADTAPGERRGLALLRQQTPRRVLLVLLEAPEWTTKATLVEALGIPPSTLNHHLRRLGEAGLLEAVRDGHEAAYRLREREQVLRLLVAHRSSLADRWVDRFLEAVEALR